MRRGSLLDLGGILVVMVALIFSAFIVGKIYADFKTGYITTVNNTAHPLSAEEQQILDNGTTTTNVFLNTIPLVILCMGIASIVLAFFIPSHPVFLPISVLLLAFFVALSTAFSNLLWVFLNDAAFISMANSHPLIVQMVRYLPHIITVLGALIIMVMYSRSGQTGGGI